MTTQEHQGAPQTVKLRKEKERESENSDASRVCSNLPRVPLPKPFPSCAALQTLIKGGLKLRAKVPSRKAAVPSTARELLRVSHTRPPSLCCSAKPVPRGHCGGSHPQPGAGPALLTLQPEPGAGSCQSCLAVLCSAPPEPGRRGRGSGDFMYAVVLGFSEG